MSKYEVLGVSRSAPLQEIKSAYQAAALATHPDKHASLATEVLKKEVCVGRAHLPARSKQYSNHLCQLECRYTTGPNLSVSVSHWFQYVAVSTAEEAAASISRLQLHIPMYIQ